MTSNIDRRRRRLLEIINSRYDASQSDLAAISAEIAENTRRRASKAEELRAFTPSVEAPQYLEFVDRRRTALSSSLSKLVCRSAALEIEKERRKNALEALLRKKLSIEKAIGDAAADQKRRRSRAG